MDYRTLGSSTLRLPVVSFGAWAIGGWMWGGTDDAQAESALQHAIDLGLTCIDTAPSYGMGHSEWVVGKAIQGRRDGLVIATKCGIRWDLAEGTYSLDTRKPDGTPCQLYRNLRGPSIRHECEQSLKRLGIDVIDLYQCHWPDPSTPLDETMDALLSLQREGKIREIGVSNFTPEMMDQCRSKGRIVSNQPLYNPLDREAEQELIPYCLRHTIGVLAYSPIAQGLMTGKVTLDRQFPEGDVRRTRPWFQAVNRGRVLQLLERLKPLAQQYEITLGQLAIAWVIAQPGVTSALVGARNPAQVQENAAAAAVRLAEDDLSTIRGMLEELGQPLPQP